MNPQSHAEAPASREAFKSAYIAALTEAVTERPDLYAWPKVNIEAVATRMFDAIERDSFNHDSLAFRKLARVLGIKPTRAGILAAWKGEAL